MDSKQDSSGKPSSDLSNKFHNIEIRFLTIQK